MKNVLNIFAVAFIALTIHGTPCGKAFAQTDIKTAPSATPAPEALTAVVPTPAETPEAQPAPAEPVPEKTAIEKVWDFLKSAGGFVAGFVVVFEIFVRAFPTKNPLSILVPVKHFIDTLGLILAWLSNLLVSLINAANKSESKLEKKKV